MASRLLVDSRAKRQANKRVSARERARARSRAFKTFGANEGCMRCATANASHRPRRHRLSSSSALLGWAARGRDYTSGTRTARPRAGYLRAHTNTPADSNEPTRRARVPTPSGRSVRMRTWPMARQCVARTTTNTMLWRTCAVAGTKRSDDAKFHTLAITDTERSGAHHRWTGIITTEYSSTLHAPGEGAYNYDVLYPPLGNPKPRFANFPI